MSIKTSNMSNSKFVLLLTSDNVEYFCGGVFLLLYCTKIQKNKTGLQPVSKPAEQILGFFQKGFYSKKGAKM